ncbi:hypothetical protein P872_02935 [Rhodonellum psychrophilum GCM71 = DSM 17998]|uniref:Uncharacterized protein n=1 Tax=Rhodonellum psychrophilum GCM71 = DSM 17998 TaxID=1123057 RepID=U5C1A6_9BACT|nr:hypothetical protein P872_02935 [Rhodonellum psychrophilum GCM71 = DSM 17998]
MVKIVQKIRVFIGFYKNQMESPAEYIPDSDKYNRFHAFPFEWSEKQSSLPIPVSVFNGRRQLWSEGVNAVFENGEGL